MTGGWQADLLAIGSTGVGEVLVCLQKIWEGDGFISHFYCCFIFSAWEMVLYGWHILV